MGFFSSVKLNQTNYIPKSNADYRPLNRSSPFGPSSRASTPEFKYKYASIMKSKNNSLLSL
jgi:hypothetical protein